MVISAAYVPSSNTAHASFLGCLAASSSTKVFRNHTSHLQIVVGKLTRQRHGGGLVHLLAVLLQELLVDLGSRGSQSGSSNELKLRISDKLAGEPEERLLEVVVGLGRDVVVLEVLLAMESDGLGLDLALLHIDLVAAENDGNVLANSDEITVPVGDVLVGNAGGDIEHDDTALAVDVITITETAKLLLTGGIPDIELNLTEVGGEAKRVNLDTEGGHVLLLKFTSQVTLDEGGLSGTTVTDKHELEGRSLLLSHLDGCVCGVVATDAEDVNKRGAEKNRC